MECHLFIVHSEIADNEFSSPFTCLRRVLESNGSSEMMSKSSTWVQSSISDVETLLAGLRFEKRNLLDELPGELVGDNPHRRP
jgi:hypothetical protein